MKEGISLCRDGVVGRIKNRRMIVQKSRKFENAVNIELQIMSKDPGPTFVLVENRGISATGFSLSNEGAKLLYECLGEYLTKIK